MEITLTEVNAMDEISIRTQFSEYQFCVTDPTLCRGFLSGGALGNQPHDAFLAGALLSESHRLSDPTRLETGVRALFYIPGKDGLNSLTTSVITELAFAATRNVNGSPGDC
jgi:hypothetical protein